MSDALTDGFVLERLAGVNRFGTSAMASKAAFPAGSTDVVVARADDFPDALAGNYLAGQLQAPVLLSDRDDLSAGVLAEIERLGATRAHVLGGPGALGPTVVTELQAADCPSNVSSVLTGTRPQQRSLRPLRRRRWAWTSRVALPRSSDR